MAVKWLIGTGTASNPPLGKALLLSSPPSFQVDGRDQKGQGFAFPVGPDQIYMVAVYSGVMLVDDGKGPLHAATIVCPGTVDADVKKGTKTGHGKCVITGEFGDRVFAEMHCTGDAEGCHGTFKLTGGTGNFAGITGEGEMISKIQAREITLISGVETVHQLGEGVAVWPKLTYRIPDNK